MTTSMSTGEIIKDLRKQKHMTQEQLADYVGVKKSAVAKWETGRTANIRRDKLHALALLFGVAPSYLLDGRNEKLMLNADEIELVKAYRGADARSQKIARYILGDNKGLLE